MSSGQIPASKDFRFPPGNSRWQNLLAMTTFLKNPIRYISENMLKFNGTYSVYLLGTGKIIITEDPEFIQYILKDNHTNYQKSELSTKTAARLFGSGLLFANGKPWLKQRRLIQPGFHQSKLQGLNDIIISRIKLFMGSLHPGEHVDIYPLMRELSFDVLIHSLFDIHLSAQTVNDLSQGFTDLQDFLLKDINQPYRKILYPINKTEKKIFAKSKNIRSILNAIINHRRSDNSIHHDLLDMLLDARYEDSGQSMDQEQIIDEILVLLFAGHETTANTLSWLIYLISIHTESAVKLRTISKQIDICDSVKHPYINAVINESMRLFPAAWMTERVAVRDDNFGRYKYPEGTIIIPFFYGLHHNKKLWEHASDFEPTRFMEKETEKLKKVKNFFPFGAGPRMCIGNHFAMTEMAFIIHSFFGSFEVLPTAVKPEMWPLITLRPRNLFLNLKKLEEKEAIPG